MSFLTKKIYKNNILVNLITNYIIYRLYIIYNKGKWKNGTNF